MAHENIRTPWKKTFITAMYPVSCIMHVRVKQALNMGLVAHANVIYNSQPYNM